MKKFLPVLTAGALLVVAGSAAAQTTVNGTASITVPAVLSLAVTGTPTFGSPNVSNFDAGEIAANAAGTITHKANVTHQVLVKAATDFFQKSAGGNSDKPVADLEFSVNGGNWVSLAANAATAGNAILSANRGSTSEPIQFRMKLRYTTDAPDTYNVAYVYTIIAN